MATRKSSRTSKTDHVLSLLAGTGGDREPEAPAPHPTEEETAPTPARKRKPSAKKAVSRTSAQTAPESAPEPVPPVQAVPASRHMAPPILEVARLHNEALSETIRQALTDSLEEELARQKEAARNITQDIVDFPGTLSITPSSVADRKPLRALVGSWAKLSNAPFDACWNQLKAAFNLANIKELPQEWIPDALAWVQAKIDALPKALPPQPERLPLYRNGCFYPPHRNRSHVPGPQEAALLELWQDWTRREAGLRQEFMAMLRELDARRGDLFSYAVSDLGRNADTMFSPQCLLDSLFQSRTEAEQRFRQALEDASLHLRLSLNMAVALGR